MAELDWDRAHPQQVDCAWFASEVVPKLQDLSANALARATGLSVSHCAKVKKGERVPHPMWWEALRRTAPQQADPMVDKSDRSG